MSIIKVDFGSISGTGVNISTGTLNTTTASAEHTFDTGLGSGLTHFIMHGYATNSYGVGIQEFIRWESSFGDNFYQGGAYSGQGRAAYQAFTSTANTYCPVIVSITNGVITLKASSNNNWSNQAFTWWAW